MTTAPPPAAGLGHAQRVALVSGTGTFGDGFDDLTLVPDELRMMRALLTESANCTIHPESGLDPTTAELKASFRRALEGDDGVPPDLLVFYYSGHAHTIGDGTLLIAAHDSEKAETDTHLTANELFTLLLPTSLSGRTRPREVVMVLDTCYAGQAVAEMRSALAVEGARNVALPDVTVIGAVDGFREAAQGHFVDAFAAAVRTTTAGDQVEYLPMHAVFAALCERMRGTEDALEAPQPRMNPLPGASLAFPNPWYLPQGVRRPQEAREGSGWVFCGRSAAVEQAVEYLTGGESAGGLLLSGAAGSGKSVLLDWIHGGAHGQPLPSGPRAPQPAPPGCLDVLVDVRGMKVEAVVWKLSAHYRTTTDPRDPQALVDALAERPGTLRLGFDSIDACADPEGLYATVLAPLAALDHVRVVMAGSRTPHGFAGRHVDLDAPDSVDAGTVTAFVKHVLRNRKDTTWGRVNEESLADVARRTAQAAGASWLRAYLFAVALSADDPATARVDAERSTADLFLSRLRVLDEDDPGWAAELLLPVALAGGEGLPADGRLWAAVAARLAGREVGAAELARVQDLAGDFLAAPEGGMYGHGWRFERLSEASYLARSVEDAGVAHAAFVRAMYEYLPQRSEGRRDWTAADRYTRSHFVHHARLAGVLEDYLDDPEFLLAMDTEALHGALTMLQETPQDKAARVRSLCIELARTNRLDGDTLSRLALLAQVHRLGELADRAAESVPGWRPSLLYHHRVAAVHCLPDGAVAVVTDDDTAEGLLLRSLPAGGGGQAWESLQASSGAPRITASSLVDAGGPALFAGQADGRAWVRRLADGRCQPITGLALGGTPVACAGAAQGLLVVSTDGWQWRPRGGPTGPVVRSRGMLLGGAAIAQGHDGLRVVARTARGIEVWRVDGQWLTSFDPPQSQGLTAVAADDGGVYTGAGDGSVWWTPWDGRAARRVAVHGADVTEVRVHSGGRGRGLVTAGRCGDIQLTPLPLGSGGVRRIDLGVDAHSVDVDAEDRLVVGTSAGVVRIAL